MAFSESLNFGNSTFMNIENEVNRAIGDREHKFVKNSKAIQKESQNETHKNWSRKSNSNKSVKKVVEIVQKKRRCLNKSASQTHYSEFFQSDISLDFGDKPNFGDGSMLRVSQLNEAIYEKDSLEIKTKWSTTNDVEEILRDRAQEISWRDSIPLSKLTEFIESSPGNADELKDINDLSLPDVSSFIGLDAQLNSSELTANSKKLKILSQTVARMVDNYAPQVNNSKLVTKSKNSSAKAINRSTTQLSKLTDMESMKRMSAWNLPSTILREYEKKGIIKMFDWQVECLSNPKLLMEHCNLVYSAPTSAGKTLVSEILLLKTVLERGKKVILILPFISVVREKMFYLQDLLTPAGYRVEGFFGGYTPPGGFESINVAICTIEKANSIVNKLMEQGKIDELGTVVVDEVHLISDPGRGYILELLLAKVLYMSRKHALQIQVITMSATLANVELLKCWLDAELYITNFRPVTLQEMIKIGSKIYDCNLHILRDLDKESDECFGKLLQTDSDHVAQLCIETLLEGCSVIVFCASKDWCENLAVQLAAAIHTIGKNGGELGLRLRTHINRDVIDSVKQQLRDIPTGLDTILEKAITYACAFHHAGLTTEERDIIESNFKSGALKIVVATSTLSSGVNLPARRVIIRSPLFGGKQMSSLTYRQMIGRAGRTGKDTVGESILICTDSNARVGRELISAELRPITSCLELDSSAHLKRALLEVIAAGAVVTKADIESFVRCTLLGTQKHMSIAEKDKSMYDDGDGNTSGDGFQLSEALQFLIEYEFVRMQRSENTSAEHYYATRLGMACLASSLPPSDGLILFSELQKSRRCFVLESELHAVYLVTPFSVCYQLHDIDWLLYLDLWEKLLPAMKKVGELVGVKESFLVRAMRGQTKLDYKLMQIHKRFYIALALQELVNEIPINEVAAKYKCTRGMLQGLQQMASTFAAIVTAFCNSLQWSTLSLIVSQFKERLFFGIHRDLIDLMRLPDLSHKRARALFDSGICTLVELANADVCTVEKVLFNSLSFDSDKQQDNEEAFEAEKRNMVRHIFITGKSSLTVSEAARQLVAGARQFLQYEIGVGNINWDQSQSDGSLHMSCEEEKFIPQNVGPSTVKNVSFRKSHSQQDNHYGARKELKQILTSNKFDNEKGRGDAALDTNKQAEPRDNQTEQGKGKIPFCVKNSKYEREKLNRECQRGDHDGKNRAEGITLFDHRNFVFGQSKTSIRKDESKQKETRMTLKVSNSQQTSRVSHRKDNSNLKKQKMQHRKNENATEGHFLSGSTEEVASDKENTFIVQKVFRPKEFCAPVERIQESIFKSPVSHQQPYKTRYSLRQSQESSSGDKKKSSVVVRKLKPSKTQQAISIQVPCQSQSNVVKKSDSPTLPVVPHHSRHVTKTSMAEDVFMDEDSFQIDTCLDGVLADLEHKNSSTEAKMAPPGKCDLDGSTDEIACSQQSCQTLAAQPATLGTLRTPHSSRFVNSYRLRRLASPKPQLSAKSRNPSPVADSGKSTEEAISNELDGAVEQSPRRKPSSSSVELSNLSVENSLLQNPMQLNASHILSCSEVETSASSFDSVQIVDICGNRQLFESAFKELHKVKRFGFSLGLQKVPGQRKPIIGANFLINQGEAKEQSAKFSSERVDFQTPNDSNYLAGIAFGVTENIIYYMNMQVEGTDVGLPAEVKCKYLRELLGTSGISLLVYDAKEQMKVLFETIPNLKEVRAELEDPKIGDWLLQPDRRLSLQHMVHQYAPECAALAKLCGSGRGYSSYGLDADSAIVVKIRCSIEACVTVHVLKGQIENLEGIGSGQLYKFFRELEMPLQYSLCRMELVGFPVSEKRLRALFQQMVETMKKLEMKIYELHGSRFNLAASTAVAKVLGLHRKINGRVSTSRQILEKIDSPISQLIIAYRKLSVTLSKNIQPLLKATCNDRIHGQSITTTATGRISMTEPNLQNVARDFEIDLLKSDKITISCRSAFSPIDIRRCLISSDFCQLEMRILAHLSQDRALLKVMHVDKDVFTAMAACWNKISEDDVTEALRNGTKQICYGIVYGMGLRSLAEALKCTEQEAKLISDQFHKAYPGIRLYADKVVRFARNNGYIETITGRRRYLDHINSSETQLKCQAERQAVNSAIQGSAADIAKNAILRMEKNIMKYREKLGIAETAVRLVLHLHDELIFEVPEDKAKKIAKVLRATMENCVKLSVPLKVKLKIGRSWGELKEVTV